MIATTAAPRPIERRSINVWRSACSRDLAALGERAGRLPGVEDKIKRSSWRSRRATGPYSSAEYDAPVGGSAANRAAAARVGGAG
jgi:hypothetical protein